MTRYAMITGASAGLGLAMAEALARRGRSLLLVARHRDPLEIIAAELTQRFGVEVLFRACDLGEPLRLSGFLLELEESERQIDLLVNCAAVRSHGHFLAQDWSQEQDLIELNILALTRLCHALGNAMAVQGGGQILNVASLAAFQPGPWMSSYAASKAYVLHFSEGLREELKQTGVKVSVLCPGPVRASQRRIPRLAGSSLVLDAEQVALQTVRALDRDRAVIVPGRRNGWLARASRLVPRWLMRILAGWVNKAYAPH
ncbi:SDR family oxidoreductase [Pseudomonas sp. CFBP 8770]|uniref:SDR family NAD(P)-dependent oxidoreductase n=1 Tax=unclassified Pseudomonas TaxID=196821 RepID=UPI001784AF8A|nr:MULTISPECIES: SDR family oxidoreductase [unclassified Pseudomonas]MBD8476101.1 SDR family oxidoreductase [Pseudomonas sp. CFBP 8773]MBD8648883.1 SDR family oxidoreductase [Pseudomonas sp. CFBP 8770]